MTKLFLSYARNDGGDLATRLKADLETAGFEVWHDLTRIQAGKPWLDEVATGLIEASAAIAVLSPQAVRTAPQSTNGLDSVCLDEISYFRFQLKRPIIPVMGITCEPPLSIYRLDHVDLRRWQENDEVYRTGLQKLLRSIEAALRGEIHYRAGICELSPLDFASFMNEKRRNFTGRNWIFEDLENWRVKRGERALLIKGDAGVGKSAIIADWCTEIPAVACLPITAARQTSSARYSQGNLLEAWLR